MIADNLVRITSITVSVGEEQPPTNELTVSKLWQVLDAVWPQRSIDDDLLIALVVQHYLGGLLLHRKMSNGRSHYSNRLPDGEVDFTRWMCRDAHPLSSPNVVCMEPVDSERYEQLKGCIDIAIHAGGEE